MASLRKVATLVGLLVTLGVSHLFLSASRSISVEPIDWPTDADEDWKSIRADDMSAEQVFGYFHWKNSSSCHVTYDFGGIVTGSGVVWGIDGQKTVCMDGRMAPRRHRCLVYSFGINNEWSFDRHFEKFGCQVWAFDPSMNRSDGNFRPNIHFLRMGIAAADYVEGNETYKTLESIYKQLETRHGPKVIDYLKIDAEGAEWTCLPQLLQSGTLDKVKQMGVEFHLSAQSPLQEFRSRAAVLRSLEDYGMIRFSSRINIWTNEHVDVLGRSDYLGHEITWYNQKFKAPSHGSVQ